jgi:hypothetical protein
MSVVGLVFNIAGFAGWSLHSNLIAKIFGT